MSMTLAERDAELAKLPPAYVSLEKRFPAWKDARQVFEDWIPERLTWAHIGGGRVEIDKGWCLEILDRFPEDSLARETYERYIEDCLNLLDDHMFGFIGSAVDMNRFSEFFRQPLTPQIVEAMNSVIQLIDDERVATGQPRIMQAIRHILGVEMCLPMMNRGFRGVT